MKVLWARLFQYRVEYVILALVIASILLESTAHAN